MGQIGGLLKEEMPREKLIRFGPNSLTDVELLAILLRTGTKEKNVIELSREILSKFDTRVISRTSYEELLKFKGIKNAKACLIVSLFELSRRLKFESSRGDNKRICFRNSKHIYEFVCDDFLCLEVEKFMVLFLDSRNKLIKKEFVFSGGFNFASVDIKFILKKVLEYNANSIIVLHNHPSGDCSPSSEDLCLTEKLKCACLSLDVKLLDHLIIGASYLSLFDKGLL